MSAFHPHYDCPTEILDVGAWSWWFKYRTHVLDCLSHAKNPQTRHLSSRSGNVFFYPSEQYIKENILNGRKPKGNDAKHSVPTGQSGTVRWLNFTLTSEDYSALEQSTADIELLACNLIQLVVRGIRVSVKYDSARKSYNVCLIRPSDRDDGGLYGLSAYAPDLRDALLSALYKFDVLLRGDFANAAVEDTFDEPRRRFG
jgi:hypothetical protein